MANIGNSNTINVSLRLCAWDTRVYMNNYVSSEGLEESSEVDEYPRNTALSS